MRVSEKRNNQLGMQNEMHWCTTEQQSQKREWTEQDLDEAGSTVKNCYENWCESLLTHYFLFLVISYVLCAVKGKKSAAQSFSLSQTCGLQQKKVHAGKTMTNNTCETCCVNPSDRYQSLRLQLSLSYKVKTRIILEEGWGQSYLSLCTACTCWACTSKSVP